MKKINTQLFIQSILKRRVKRLIFSNSKLNVAINFRFLFFGVKIDQLITLQVIKVPRGEDPRVEVPRWGGEGRGKRRKRGGRVLAFVVLVHAALIFRAYLACTGMCR